MAYMNQVRKKELEAGVKAVLKKHGLKGRLGVQNHSTLVLNLSEGKVDFAASYNEVASHRLTSWGDPVAKCDESFVPVNEYHIESQFAGKAKDILLELKTAMMAGNWDKSDIMSDYHNVGWYIDINIGRYDRPYKLV